MIVNVSLQHCVVVISSFWMALSLPRKTRCLMFSSITSLYSFLWGMSIRAHSSWVKTTATSSNVTDSCGCMVSDSVSRCFSLGFHSVLRTKQAKPKVVEWDTRQTVQQDGQSQRGFSLDICSTWRFGGLVGRAWSLNPATFLEARYPGFQAWSSM